MKSAKLSVVMTNYNHAEYIAGALSAIVSQSFKPFEVLVCDDGSTDNSAEVIQQFVDRYPFVRLIRNNSNLGIFASIDKLLALASGDYLYSAAADDRILPGFFEKSMQLLQQYPQAGLCSALAIGMDENGRSKGVFQTPIISASPCFFSPLQVQEIFLKQGCWIFGISAIFRFDYLKKEGGFRKELHSFCDGFVEHVLALRYGACFIPEPLAAWRKADDTYSATIAKNPEMTKQWIGYAKNLMCTTYKDLFPPNFVDRWEKRELLNYQLSRDLNLKNARLAERSRTSKNFFSKGSLSAARIFIRIQYFILKAYRYYRAGLPTGELFIQRIKNVWLLAKIQKKLIHL